MSALECAINLISDDEAEGIETSQHSDLISDDEDIVPPRRRLAPKSRSIQDNVFSDSESDDEPIRVGSIRSRVRQVQPMVARITSNDELGFLRKHYSYLEDEDEHTAKGVYFRLENFSIQKKATGQMESLNRVAVHDNKLKPQYCFSGILVQEDGSRQKVSEIDIWHVSIDNLAEIEDNMQPSFGTAAKSIYLETVNSSRYNCFYLLGSASEIYTEIYRNFQWLADFLKHITDYLTWSSIKQISVKLEDFKSNFITVIKSWHNENGDFKSWYSRCSQQVDFRQYLCCPTNTKFIFYTIESITDEKDDLIGHAVWDDLGLRTTTQEMEVSYRTLVTPNIAFPFLESFPQWGDDQMELLELMSPVSEVLEKQKRRSQRVELGEKSFHDQTSNFEECEGRKVSKAALFLERASTTRTVNITTKGLIGHAVVARQHSHRCSQPCRCDTYKLALVVSASNNEVGVRWLSLPKATICAGRVPEKRRHEDCTPFYPIGNEVFLSDECSCEKVLKSDIFAMTSITINKDHAEEGHELFVHRKWVSHDSMLCEFDNDEIRRCPEHEEYDKPLSNTQTSRTETETATMVGLFSGLGLLDLGIVEGSKGRLATKLVVELDKDAMLSYRANHQGDQPCEFHNGDVNEPFRLFCLGEKDFPTFAVLVAGNPCPGFSILNPSKATPDSQRKCTLLPHTLSWIDVFRPEMVLIENVLGMDQTRPSALGQAVCCLVSMGYQVKALKIKASAYGAATIRPRLILLATAPGIPLPELPLPTHGTNRMQRPIVTVSAITSDLHSISNDTLINPKIPYHVPVHRLKPEIQKIVSKIPETTGQSNRTPNITDAILESPEELEFFDNLTAEQRRKSSGTLRRAHPNKAFGTITTHMSIMNSRSPGSLHWAEDRVVSLLELRRFQGVPDKFLQIGTADKQVCQVGNSVEYNLAKLLGRILAESWMQKSTHGTRTRIQARPLDEVVIHELSDDDDDDDDGGTDGAIYSRSVGSSAQRYDSSTISIDVPLVEKVRRQLRASLSLEPNVETVDEFSDVSASSAGYGRRKRRIVLEESEEAEDYTQGKSTTSPETNVKSARLSSSSDDSDDLPDLRTLLTPSRSQLRNSSIRPRRYNNQSSSPTSSSQSARYTVRRRRRSSSDDSTDGGESPTKKLKMNGMTLSSSKPKSTADRYVFGTSLSPPSFASVSEGETAESPIVLD